MDVYQFIDWGITMLAYGAATGFLVSVLLDWIW